MMSMIKENIKDILALHYYVKDKCTPSAEELICGVDSYIDHLRVGDCEYRFSASVSETSLLSSALSLMIMGLCDKTVEDKEKWYKYLNSFQSDDGIWRDKAHPLRLWKDRDDEWNDIHIIPHIIYAYEVLGESPKTAFSFLDKFKNTEYTEKFCQNINYNLFWGESNGIMNYLVSMLYARDTLGDYELQNPIEMIFLYLNNRMRETDGLWTHRRDRDALYEAVRGGYHIWMLMIREGIVFEESQIRNIIDTVLDLQNQQGGFNDRVIADTCHNIDCIDPLIRFSLMMPTYRKNEIEVALRKARNYLLGNWNKDGGFCFSRIGKLTYGSSVHKTRRNESSMFGTWFTLVALLLINDYFYSTGHISSNLPGYEQAIRL